MQCVKCKKEIPDGSAYCAWCGKSQNAQQKKHRRRANGTGTVFRRNGNRKNPWIVEKNGMFISSHKSYSEAQKALERLTDDEITDRYNLTFTQVYELWKKEYFRGISKSHQDDYSTSYNRCPELYNLKFRSIRKSDFMAVILRMEEAGYAESTIEKQIQLFGSLSRWAMSECIINVNHAQFVKTVATQKTKRSAFTKAELAAIKGCNLKQAAIMRILIATGCRPKDLFTAKLEDCHENYFVSGSKSEAGYDRAIGVSDYGLADYQMLRRLASEKPGAQRLIDGYEGDRVYKNWQKREYKVIRDALNLGEKTPYYSRHTYATYAAKSGIPQDILRRQMGHEDIHTTDAVYKHFGDQEIASYAVKVHIPGDAKSTGKAESPSP